VEIADDGDSWIAAFHGMTQVMVYGWPHYKARGQHG